MLIIRCNNNLLMLQLFEMIDSQYGLKNISEYFKCT